MVSELGHRRRGVDVIPSSLSEGLLALMVALLALDRFLARVRAVGSWWTAVKVWDRNRSERAVAKRQDAEAVHTLAPWTKQLVQIAGELTPDGNGGSNLRGAVDRIEGMLKEHLESAAERDAEIARLKITATRHDQDIEHIAGRIDDAGVKRIRDNERLVNWISDLAGIEPEPDP